VGAADFVRPEAAAAQFDKFCQISRELRRGSCAAVSCGGPPKNLTFKIKFAAANICSKFDFFCQIFSAHSMSCDRISGCVPTIQNLKKLQNSFIIYIESEREIKSQSAVADRTRPPLSARIQR